MNFRYLLNHVTPFISGCVIAFSVFGQSHAQAPATTTLRITTIPEEAATEQIRKFTPLANYLEKQLNYLQYQINSLSMFPQIIDISFLSIKN